MISVNKRIKAGSVLAALALVITACGSDDKADSTTATPTTTAATTATTAAPTDTSTAASTETTTADSAEIPAVTTGDTSDIPAATTPETGDIPSAGDDGVTTEGITDARCAENKAAGTVTYASSFDFSASASIVDVLVAKDKGYFDDMCLDVDIKPGFSTTNYPLVAEGTANFSSAGNYTEIINNSGDGAEFVAVVDYGKAPIEALVTPDGGATKLEDLKGKTIGVKGDLPPSIVAMLAKAGLKRGTDYKELLLDGFDPVAQLESGIDALPVYKSNEPGQLDAANVKYNLFDPVTDSIPGSFGLIYTSKDYADKHPTVVQDFARAALHGMEDALADIKGAVAISVKFIDAGGNAYFLTEEGETYRWTQEAKVVVDETPTGEPVGLIDPDLLKAEYDAYYEAGVWPEVAPDYLEAYDDTVARSVYDADGAVIWPAG
jgi:ABC-type nitrate/sulfonate/bicarbonate transport system substrate-binding protein